MSMTVSAATVKAPTRRKRRILRTTSSPSASVKGKRMGVATHQMAGSSLIKYLIDTNARRDITLFYLVSDPAEISFRDILDAAAPLGVKVVVVVDAKVTPTNWTGPTGPLTPELITRHVPDAAARLTYISGPSFMVDHYRGVFRKLGVPARRLITDHFSGY